MSLETLNKLQEIATQLAVQLGVASNIVYSKLIWYTKMRGIINLTGWSIIAVVIVILNIIAFRMAKRYEIDNEGVIIGGIIGNFVAFVLAFAVVSTIVNNITQIIIPEYWIIKQIMEGVLR